MAESGWYVQIMGSEVGPFSSAQLKEKAAKGQIERDMLVRKAGTNAWSPASKIKGLFADEPNQPPPPPAEMKVESQVEEPVQSIARDNPYASVPKLNVSGSQKAPRKYPALEFYTGLLKALAITSVVLGVLAILFVIVVSLQGGLVAVASALGVSLVIVVYTAIVAFGLLLASELIKMSLDVASDIKHIADQR